MALIVLFGLLGAAANWIALKMGFFSSPSFREENRTHLSLFPVVGVFFIYLSCSFILSTIIASLFSSKMSLEPIFMVNWTQLLTTTISIALLFFFARSFVPKLMLAKVWKDREYSRASSVAYDIGMGLFTWFLAFPVVMIIGEVCDIFIYYAFNVENYDQVAVLYLKMTHEHPSLLVIALFVILVAAPCIEEFLFRGMLQSWLRQHLGPKAAILLAALGFALFHMASSQGWGNLSLVVSLFVFACYLGFVYEKQRSLFASISLHMAFNAVSAWRILFIPE